MNAALTNSELLTFAAQIVSAHVSHNAVLPEALPGVIQSVYAALSGLGAPEAAGPQPVVPIKKSVFPDYIVCLEDGKKIQLLKRHLSIAHGGMTPEAYRERWGLPQDYPMTAPNYAARRSVLAKSFWLDRRAAVDVPPVQNVPVGGRGRVVTMGKKAPAE